MRDKDLMIPAAILADRGLRPAAKLVLAHLLRLARSGGLVFVSRYALAQESGLSTSAVESALAGLEAAGRILREVSDGGRGRPCGYRILGGTLRFAGPRVVPASEGTGMSTKRVTQLNLFDQAPLGPVGNSAMGKSVGRSTH